MNKKLLQTLAFATFSTIFTSGSLVAMNDERHHCITNCALDSRKCEDACESIKDKAAYGTCHVKCVDTQTACLAKCPK